jgi:hypothetical protein
MRHYLNTRPLPAFVKGWAGELLCATALAGGLIAMALGA